LTVIQRSTTPWYRQFWPWFIIALPGMSVVMGLSMLYIAIYNADTLVKDNYYKHGLAINEQLDQDRLAAELGLSAKVTIDGLSGEVIVELYGSAIAYENLQLLLIHPVDESRDMEVSLSLVDEGRYRADLSTKPENRYYLRLQPADSATGKSAEIPSWRLNGELDLDILQRVLLESDSANS